jgi:hypothetical protein
VAVLAVEQRFWRTRECDVAYRACCRSEAANPSSCRVLAAAQRVGYSRSVPRRAASFLTLLAVIAAPAVTSTRLFCQYTGEEIVGCAESGVPQQAQVRGEQCCQRRTFHALDGVRLVEDQRQQAPAPVVIDAAPLLVADVFAVASSALRLNAAPSVGPPAFLSHRALLI